MKRRSTQLLRRRLLAGAAGGALLPWALPLRAQENASLTDPVEEIVPAAKQFTQGKPVQRGKVKMEIPFLAENGNLVPFKVSVDNPMRADNYVQAIIILSEKNPRPVIAKMTYTPKCGRAELVTRIRLATSQRLVALAQLSDGSFWSDTREVVVTETACLDAT